MGASVVGATVVGATVGATVVAAAVVLADEAGASALEVCEHAESATSALVAHSQAIPVRSEVMVCDEPWGEAAVALPD